MSRDLQDFNFFQCFVKPVSAVNLPRSSLCSTTDSCYGLLEYEVIFIVKLGWSKPKGWQEGIYVYFSFNNNEIEYIREASNIWINFGILFSSDKPE